jgi:hypothetical protein
MDDSDGLQPPPPARRAFGAAAAGSGPASGFKFWAGRRLVDSGVRPSRRPHGRAVTAGRDWTSFCRWANYVTCLPAWVGCLVKVPSTGRTTFAKYHLRAGQRLLATHHCHWIGTARPGLILTSPAPGRGLRHWSLRPRPTPPVPPGPLRTSVPDGGLTVTGAPGCRRCRSTVQSLFCSMCFMCVRPLLLFLLTPQLWSAE